MLTNTTYLELCHPLSNASTVLQFGDEWTSSMHGEKGAGMILFNSKDTRTQNIPVSLYSPSREIKGVDMVPLSPEERASKARRQPAGWQN